MRYSTAPHVLSLALIIALSACDSSSVSTSPQQSSNTMQQGSITIPDTPRDPLTDLPNIAFDGEFQTTANPDSGSGDSPTSAESESEPAAVDGVADSDGGTSDSSDEPIIGPTNPNTTIEPGTLTAGDYDDHLNPHLYQDYASDYLQNRGQWIDTPRLDFNSRILIQVSDQSGNPYANAQVRITSAGSAATTLHTAANGQTSIYKDLDSVSDDFTLTVSGSDGTSIEQTIDFENAIKAGLIYVTLDTDSVAQSASTPIDLMFVMDTTGSMGDELSFLQTELSDIIDAIPQQQTNVNIGLVFYRDYGDTYVVRTHSFSDDINAVQLNLNQEQAQGGGDYPEAMDQALNAAMSAQWRNDSRKILFLLADAPPHGDRMRATWQAAEKARTQNIHLVPVAASGVAEDAEYIMRSIAALTNSRYLFLTDDSGFGSPHAEPDIDCYIVTSLRNSMIRAMNSLVTGQRIEPSENDIIRTEGNYNNGICDPGNTPDNPVEYSILLERISLEDGSFTSQRSRVIDNQSTLDNELAVYGESQLSVDFNSQRVLLIDMGQRNTGGYQISIDAITEFDDYVQAEIGLIGPGPNCGVTQALTNPYVFASVNTTKEIRITENSRQSGCD